MSEGTLEKDLSNICQEGNRLAYRHDTAKKIFQNSTTGAWSQEIKILKQEYNPTYEGHTLESF